MRAHIRKNTHERNVYLPSDRWMEFGTKREFKGPCYVTSSQDMPIFIFWLDWAVVDRNFSGLNLTFKMLMYRIKKDKRIRKIIIDTITTNRPGVLATRHYGFK
ncbi:MAG: hypothetical protein QXN16_02840 [Candidatus Micrarchaeaceae archaeon]